MTFEISCLCLYVHMNVLRSVPFMIVMNVNCVSTPVNEQARVKRTGLPKRLYEENINIYIYLPKSVGIFTIIFFLAIISSCDD